MSRAEANPESLRALATRYEHHADALEQAVRTLRARYDFAGHRWSDDNFRKLGEDLARAMTRIAK
ncbi:MAG: hypothetical protein ACKO5K_14060, partial [Armatimonadota bacterium]